MSNQKTYKLRWTTNAKNDLLDIVDYIKKESPQNAKNIYIKIKERAKSSNFFPMKGRVVPELQKEGITHYREIIVPPWRIIYKVGTDTVYIMSIIDSRRDVEKILFKKIIDSNL